MTLRAHLLGALRVAHVVLDVGHTLLAVSSPQSCEGGACHPYV